MKITIKQKMKKENQKLYDLQDTFFGTAKHNHSIVTEQQRGVFSKDSGRSKI